MAETVATGQNRVLMDMIAELTRNRKSVPASQGLYALRRRINNLSTNGRRLLKLTSEQVVWQDGCFSVSTEAKWDETRCGRDIVLSNNNTTVTRSNGNEWGGVLGAQLYTSGNHSFTFHINKCQTDYVYIGVAYDNVDLNDNYNARNIVLRAGDGSFRVFSASQGCYGGFRTGDNIRVEVDMNDKVVTFYKNDVRLCQATGITASLRPFVSIGARDVVITMKTQDPKLALEVSETQPRSPMIDIAVRTGLELIFAILLKEENKIIRARLLRSALSALQSLPPLSFYCEASGLKEEALCSAADFLKSISTSDVEADQQERQIAAMVLLELAVARGLLSFTLSIMVHLMEHNVVLDASVFPTLRRLGNIDSITDPKLRSLFSETHGTKQGNSNAGSTQRLNESQNEVANDPSPSLHQGSENERVATSSDDNKDDVHIKHKSLKISGDAQDARLIAEAAEQEVGKDPTCGVLYSVIILAQLEHAAKRLKSSNAVLAPCSVDASPRTLRQLHALISSHSSIIDHLKDAEDCNVWSCYVLLALVRLLALNLRQIQRHPNMSELEPDLLASLRALLLKLVAGSAKTSAEGQIAYISIQEEAVAALRAGTPVLFSDPVELVGLLEIMLPKHCEEKASQTEEQFLVMLLSYIAKPPVIWRVLQLDNATQTDAETSPKKEVSLKDNACLRFFECLLNSTMHYLKTSLKSGKDAKDPPKTNEVIPTACGEVLQVAWRLQHVHWSNLLASEDSKALALCSQMAISALNHVVQVIELTKEFIEVQSGDCNVAVLILEHSAVYKFLPEILAGVSSMPPHEKILASLNSLLGGLDSLSPKLPGVVLNALDPTTPADLRKQHELALQRLSTQQIIKQQVVNATLNNNEEGRSDKTEEIDREVVAIQGASYLLVELDMSACKLGSSGQLTIEDGLGHVLAGKLTGCYNESESSILPIIVPGETVVFNFSSRDSFKTTTESSERDQVAYKATVTGYFAPSFSVECIEAHVDHPCNSNETSSPLALPDTTIVSQISFDPESCLKPSSCVALTLGGHLQVFTGDNDSASRPFHDATEFLQSMDTSTTSSELFKDQLKSCHLLPFPSFPLLTVDPNIRFDHVDASTRYETSNSESCVAKGPVNSFLNGKYGWKAFVCSVSVPRDADAHWMMEILRLTACVSAQLSGAMVSGLQGNEIETACKKWITSDLLRGGRLEDIELENVTKDCLDKQLRLPGRPHPLRQSTILDKVESAAALAMLHHVGLLSYVKQNVDSDGNVNIDEEEHVAVLRKIAMAAGNLRRALMQQRDQQLADPERNVDSDSKESPAAATNNILNYDALCLPVIERAECLLRFVPALGKREIGQGNNACTESLAHVEDTSLKANEQTDVSPTKKWQQAALRIIGGNGASSLANKECEMSNSHDAGTSIDASAPSSSSEEFTEDMSGGKPELEQQSGWSYVIPLIRVHRAYWRVKQRVKQREDNIIDLVSKFLLSEFVPGSMEPVLVGRDERADEIENGLRYLAEMLEHLKVRVVRAEILQALFNSNWSVRHYLSDISASSALKIGRVRALFNKVCRLLVDILKDPSSSCQLKGFAASSLVMLYEAPDLTYLNMIGLPNVLREFVDTNGASLHLSTTINNSESCFSGPMMQGAGSITIRRMNSPVGSLWFGVSDKRTNSSERQNRPGHLSTAKEMSLRLAVHQGILRGAGIDSHGAFTIEGVMQDPKTVEFESSHSWGRRTTCAVEVAGRTMQGKWTRGPNSGTLTLHRTHRIPVEPSYFSRVNTNFIRFEGRAVVFTGTNQIGVVQAAKPLTKENSYFEVQVLDRGKDCAIAVGVAHRDYPLDQMPGWRNGSIAYHMDDGKLFFQRGQGSRFGDKCGQGDIVGCGIELSEDGKRVASVYWTRNGELAGREQCASVLLLPLYASVALHSEGESVFIFEAPPPPSLTSAIHGLVNAAGNSVRLGTDRGFTHLYYCGQRQGTSRGSGSQDSVCGPSGGSQCAACEALQESIANRDMSEASTLPGEEEKATYDSLGEGDFYSSLSSRTSPSDAEMKQLVARESVWRLLRILLLQISDNMTNITNGQICEAQRSLWGTLLAALQQLSARVEINSPAVLLDCGRAAVMGSRCVESVTASCSGDQVPNLLLPDMTSSWTSVSDGEHWVQIVARNEVCLSRMGVYIHPDDGAMMPREIRILAGENEGCLRAIQVVEVDPRELNQGPNEVIVLQGSDENLNVVRLCLTSNGPIVRLRGISVRGFMFGDPNVIGRGELEEACIFKRVEVSTGKSAKKFLTDGRNDTFWQSDGRSGQHWIRLHVEPDAVITGLSIQVSASDGNYCPSLVDVFVGEVASNLKKIRTCNLTPTGNQRCVLLDKVNLMHRIVQVNIRENNGGCDCKVRGIFLTGHFAPTKRPGLDVGNTGQVLRDLLSTAYATSKARVVGINPAQSREWIRMLTKLMQLPVFGEATRIRATTLLHKLCVSWANMEGSLTLDKDLQEDVIHAILDTLSHTSEICASMEPLSPSHLSPLPDLHSLLCKVAVDLIATPAWMPIMQPSIKESLTYLLDMYSPNQREAFVKYDFMEVWWSSSNDYESMSCNSTSHQGHEFFRPASGCKPRVVLFSASAPEPMRMLLNLSGLGNDTSQASSFHIESFDVEVTANEHESSKPTVSGVYVWLRPLSTPGRPQMGSSRYLMFELIKKSRRGRIGRNGGNVGGVILAQSLEHLLQLMKGENISSSEAEMGSGSITIPTDIPWFVRLGKLTDKGPVLLSSNWTMLAGCRDLENNQSPPPPNHILPSPVPTALPAVLLAEGIAQRSQLSDVACELFPSLLQVLTVISKPDPSEPARPHGLRVLHSRLVRAAYLFLQIPLCMEILLLEQGEPLRDILLLLASQDVNAPLVLALDDLLSKSAFLCQRLGPESHLHTLSLPRSIVGSLSVPRLALSWGGKSATESSIETIDTEPEEPKSQSQLLTWTSQSKVIQESEGDDEEKRVEEMVACMFANAATEEHLLLPTSRREPDKSKPPSHTWSKKLGRYRTPRLLSEIATTEDAIAIYYARLALLTILHAAPTGSLPLTVENLATILRRLFRTVKPDLSSQSWRQSMRKVLDNALTASDEERPNLSKVLGLSKHCSWLLKSLTNKDNTEKDRVAQLTPPAVSPSAVPGSSLKVMRISLESRHGYAPNTHLAIRLRAHGASALRVSLDPRCCSKRDRDKLTLYSDAQLKQQLACFHGPSGAGNWAPPPDIQGNSLVVVFESDGGHGEWGFRIYIQPLDAEMRAISVPSFLFESVPAYSQTLKGKQDVTLYADNPDMGESSIKVMFDKEFCSAQPSSTDSGRLKIISSRGKHLFQSSSSWEAMDIPRTSKFTIDVKGPATNRLAFRFFSSLQTGDCMEDGVESLSLTPEGLKTNGEDGISAGVADFEFICWLMNALSSPSNGLLWKCKLNSEELQREIKNLIEAGLVAIEHVAGSSRPGLLRSIASAARGLRRDSQGLSESALSIVRVLREAAIHQHAVELPQVGSQRAQFSPGLQALVEVVAVLDQGSSIDLSSMSRKELIRAIEAVDGPPGTALCKAVLEGNEEQVRWCLCRGARADAPCTERLVSSFPVPHYAIHYAVFAGRDDLVKLLFAKHADLHSIDGNENQPLAWAASRGMKSTVEVLLQLGADCRHRNSAGKTALDLATQAQTSSSTDDAQHNSYQKPDYKGVIQVLQKHGANCVPLSIQGLVLCVEAGHGMPSVDGPQVLRGIHLYPIERTTRATEWRCDGCTSQGQGARYRSTGQGCDFDLCQACWDAACRFRWDDVRETQLSSESGSQTSQRMYHTIQAVASHGYNPLPESWRHDNWLPSDARCKNDGRCGFPYLHLDGNSVLRTRSPCRVGTIFLVLRLGSEALGVPPHLRHDVQCIMDVGPTRLLPWESRSLNNTSSMSDSASSNRTNATFASPANPRASGTPARTTETTNSTSRSSNATATSTSSTAAPSSTPQRAWTPSRATASSTATVHPADRNGSQRNSSRRCNPIVATPNSSAGSTSGSQQAASSPVADSLRAGSFSPASRRQPTCEEPSAQTVATSDNAAEEPGNARNTQSPSNGSASESESSQRFSSAPNEATDFVEGAFLMATTSHSSAVGSAWSKVWRLSGSQEIAQVVDEKEGLSGLFDGTWQVVALQAETAPLEHLHLMGSRRGSNKCRGDIAEVLVYDHCLGDDEVEKVFAHLKTKYCIQSAEADSTSEDKVPKELLVRRIKDIHASTPIGSRLDIPKWLDRYIKCFQVVDTLIKNAALPRWFTSEIEPRSGEPCSPCATICGSVNTVQSIEALFDPARCGSHATLDANRTKVEFSGMATALITAPVPSEGVHVMEFDVHGRDQCLVGIATPDVDLETYLGHRRGGYGFFAGEGTLKVDGDWKGGHGLCKFKRGDRVGVHVDMTRRTLQFSISKWTTDTGTGQGKWSSKMLERIVEGLPSVVHFAVGGAAGGELSIAGGSASASAGEERIAMIDMYVDGGYDNPNWPNELDEQLVEFLNEKASERRKHPRNIRSSSIVGDSEAHIILADDNTGTSGSEPVPQATPVETMEEEFVPATGTQQEVNNEVAEAGVELRESEETEAQRTVQLQSEAEAIPQPSENVSDDGSEYGEKEMRDYVRFQRSQSNSLGGIRSVSAVRARFVVLKKLESLVAVSLPLVDLRTAYDPDSAAGRLVRIKGRLFEATKTHLWDAAIRLTQDRREEIPSVTLYRGAAAQHRKKSGVQDTKGTVFGQLFAALEDLALLRAKSKGKGMMAWQVSFVGEGGDDYGGLFRESIRELAADLQSPATPLFIPSPNGRFNVGFHRDTFVPNPTCTSALHMRQYTFIGKIMGAGIRTNNPLGLDFPPLIWRRFLQEPVSVQDLSGVDERFVRAIEVIRTHPCADTWTELGFSPVAAVVGGSAASNSALEDSSFNYVGLVWTVRSISGKVFELVKGGSTRPVLYSEREQYAKEATSFRLQEFDKAIDAMREGLGQNVPLLMLPLLTYRELMVRVCGEVTVDLDVLKSIVKNKLDVSDAETVMGWIWSTLEEFSNEERKQFLGFVWGRERLPRDTSGLQLEVRTQASHGDGHLPSSHTCFNALDIPRYSSMQVLRDKLRYAIAHCKAIDTDFAARGTIGEEVDEDEEMITSESAIPEEHLEENDSTSETVEPSSEAEQCRVS